MNNDRLNPGQPSKVRTAGNSSTPPPVPRTPRGRPRKDERDREADQRALVSAAIDILRGGGTAAITARAVADRVGTAVGSVYAAFPNLEVLRLGVNTATLGLLRDILAAALAPSKGRPLEERLLGLADAYMGFAQTEPGLWAALFEPRTLPAPPAMAERTADLFALLEDVLREAGCTTSDVPALGRALWAAVHGTVFLAGYGSLGPVRPEDAAALVHTLMTTIAGGIARQSPTRTTIVT